MRLNSVSPCVEFSHRIPQSCTLSSVQSSLFTPSSTKKCKKVRISNPLTAGVFKKALTRGHICCSYFDRNFHEDQLDKGSTRVGGENEEHRENKSHRAISGRNSMIDRYGLTNEESFSPSQFYFLEPMMLGIMPDPPDWPEREAIIRTIIEHKAKSLDLPVSLRMIKKKLQMEEGFAGCGDPAVNKAFGSMVGIIVDLQSYALRMREELCGEDLEMIRYKVQQEMHSSFVWLFQHVLSSTPSLMIDVMVLLANFSAYSCQEKQSGACPQIEDKENVQIGNSIESVDQDLRSVEEVKLWDSMLDEAISMQSSLKDEVLDRDMVQHFVSPVFAEREPYEYEEYLRTDFLYQMNLSNEPSNPLLLCNYAQFLHLVIHDHARAEEWYKRAVEVLPPDAESLSQYANFLWTVKRDFWGAEEKFLQALAAAPENSYYASRYASFLWSTGGEETCFPLDNSHTSSNS